MVGLSFPLTDTRDISGRVASFPLTDTRDISGRVASFPLTDTRDISGRVVIAPLMGAIFLLEDEMLKERGFYVIRDKFFEDFPDPYLKGNKEERRPHYFAFKDKKTHLMWMIPLSSRTAKYQGIISKRKYFHKPNDTLHICELDNGRASVFLLQDMFPITEEYIQGEYMIDDNPLTLTSDAEAEIIHQKAMRILNLIHRNVAFTPTQPDVLSIENVLLERLCQSDT